MNKNMNHTIEACVIRQTLVASTPYKSSLKLFFSTFAIFEVHTYYDPVLVPIIDDILIWLSIQSEQQM